MKKDDIVIRITQIENLNRNNRRALVGKRLKDLKFDINREKDLFTVIEVSEPVKEKEPELSKGEEE